MKQFELPNGTFSHCVHAPDELKPALIAQHGTKVVLLGNETDENTAVPPKEAAYRTHWLVRYRNRRYFEFPPDVRVRVREFSKRDREEWTVRETNRMAEGAQLREVYGQKHFLDKYAEASGTVPVTGAVAQWWLLPTIARCESNWTSGRQRVTCPRCTRASCTS